MTAVTALKAIQRAVPRNVVALTLPHDYSQLWTQFVHEKVNLEGRKPESMKKYRGPFASLMLFADCDLEEITPQVLSGFVASLEGRAETTKELYLNQIASFFKWAAKRKHIPENPFEDFKRKSTEKPPPNGIRWSEVITSIENIGGNAHSPVDHAFLLILAFSGGRLQEVLHRKVADWDPETGMITFTNTKGRRPRSVYVDDEVAKKVNSYLSWRRLVFPNSPYLFPGPSGKPMKGSTIRQRMYSYGINATPKQFRTAFATQLLRSGAPLNYVKESLGHVSIATTAKYLVLFDEEKRAYRNNLSLDYDQPVDKRGRRRKVFS